MSIPGKQIVPSKSPSQDPDYKNHSTAKPLHKDSFGSKDARTRVFQAKDQIIAVTTKAASDLDDPKLRRMFVDQIDALSKIIRDTLPKEK